MEKTRLNRFIQKYNLNGSAESVKWTFKENKLSTQFITPDRALLGMVTMKNTPFDEMELGIYDTAQLLRLLAVLDNDLSLNISSIGDRLAELNIKNGSVSVDFTLADMSIIPAIETLKRIPEFETQIKIDSKFIETFIRGKNALPDSPTFSIMDFNNMHAIVIGYTATSTHRVNIPVETITWNIDEPITFGAEIFKEVLIANKECKSAILAVSNEGLAKIVFNVDDYDSTYYLNRASSSSLED